MIYDPLEELRQKYPAYFVYDILSDKVQRTYRYAKRILISQGFNEQLRIYLSFGQGNQPKEWRVLGKLIILRPYTFILLLIVGGILTFTQHILFGIGFIVVSIMLIGTFAGRKEKKYLMNVSAIEFASQKIGSHKLMRIVAEEMSKNSSIEEIAEVLKEEIEEVLKEIQKFKDRGLTNKEIVNYFKDERKN